MITAGPLVLATLMALIVGFKLKFPWGIPMFTQVGLLAIALVSGRFNRDGLKRIAVSAAAVVVVVPLAYALVPSLQGYEPLTRGNWPQAEISKRMGEIWARETGRPLRIVAGDHWVAGIVGVTAKDKPSVFTNGSFEQAPWITPSRVDGQGMLVVWQEGRLPPLLQPVMTSHPVRQARFSLPRSRQGDLVLNYIVVPPKLPP